MQKIVPCLWFDNQAEQAAHLYTSVFPQAGIDEVTRYGSDMPGPEGEVMTVTFRLAGQEFMGLNGGPVFSFTPAISFFVECPTEADVDRLWQTLAEGGQVMMPLDSYPFSEKFGWLADRFGVSWQISLTRTPLKIHPYFLFVGDQHGRAEEAMQLYTSLFDDAAIQHIERHSGDQGDPEGTILHARFTLAGQGFIAMDSAAAHQFTFTPAISFYVHCADQAEVDYFWENLGRAGEFEQCGWLKDRFGISWQIVPDALLTMMRDPDPARANRVTQAMLTMTKIDIDQLEQAYQQV
jgi:predicted 3-demethylubiquinone-9 3-methyltransferase (glyoxalase superfamily)